MRGHIASGIALAFQFFSVVPVKKALPMEKRDITVMYMALPLLGAVLGAAAMGLAFLFQEYTDASPLLGAFLLVFFFFSATGGLHLDGVADTADAYFSYQNREKRLEIMGDPRIGAFGTMALLFAVAGKIIVLAEFFPDLPLLWLMIVPMLSRTGLLILFNWTNSAKKDGLAAFFQQRADKRWLARVSAIYLILLAALLLYVGGWSVAFAVLAAFLLFLFLYRRWCLRNFGGMTGDLFGAYVEGAEILLWTMCLFFI